MPDDELNSRHPMKRRHNDGKVNWAAIGVGLAFLLNLCTVVWSMAVQSTNVQVLQSGMSEMRAVMATLSTQSSANSVRLGILESKVDDLRDSQRKP